MSTADIMSQLAALVGEYSTETDESVPYWLPTCLPNVNMALSGKPDLGFAGGRLITIAGPESSGKTALATEAVVAGQRQGGFGWLNDYEHAWHAGHARGLGLDYKRFYEPKNKPVNAEEGFETAYQTMRVMRAAELGIKLPENSDKAPTAAADALRKALRGKKLSELVPLVGIMDSIASMIPRSQDIEYTKQNMKTRNLDLAMMLSIELKRLARDASDTGSTVFLLNQLRSNPGVMFGDNQTEPGGASPKYYASTMIRLRRVEKLYEEWGDNKSPIIGDVVEMFVRKNKVYRPFQKTRYVFRTTSPVGLDPVLTMIYLGKEAGVLGPVSGKTIEFGGKKRWSISDAEKEFRSDTKALKELTDFVMGNVNPVSEQAPAEEGAKEEADLDSVFAGLAAE